MSVFRDGDIDGVVVKRLKKYSDERGWLMEVFRTDELPSGVLPVMSYISMTLPGVARGPHEHMDQTDYFCFAGPSIFRLYMWDNRPGSPTRGRRMVLEAGSGSPTAVIVPPRVVHAYRNVGDAPGLVINCPNRLFMGEGRRSEVDEVRHEDRTDSPFLLD